MVILNPGRCISPLCVELGFEIVGRGEGEGKPIFKLGRITLKSAAGLLPEVFIEDSPDVLTCMWKVISHPYHASQHEI